MGRVLNLLPSAQIGRVVNLLAAAQNEADGYETIVTVVRRS